MTALFSAVFLSLAYAQAGRKAENYAYAELKFEVDGDGNVSFSNIGARRTVAVDTTRDKHTYEGQNANDLDDDILALLHIDTAPHFILVE